MARSKSRTSFRLRSVLPCAVLECRVRENTGKLIAELDRGRVPENPGLAGSLQSLPNRGCWIAWALLIGSGTSLPHWRGLPDSLKGKWQRGAAQAFLTPSKHSGSPDPLRRAQKGTGSPATGTGELVPSHPLQRGRGSLKGRGASQAPSFPFKANLWQTLLPGARNALER